MRQSVQDAVRQRFRFRCGYCGVSETDAGALLTIDHYQPRSRNGGIELDNLVYCCHACNEFKGDHWQPDSPQHILHPLRDDLSQHLQEREDGVLQSLTETGAFYIERLHLNRPALVAHRLRHRQVRTLLAQQKALLERVRTLEAQAEEVLQQISRLEE